MLSVKIADVTGESQEAALIHLEVHEDGQEVIQDVMTYKTCCLMRSHHLTIRQLVSTGFGRACNAIGLAESFADLKSLKGRLFVSLEPDLKRSVVNRAK